MVTYVKALIADRLESKIVKDKITKCWTWKAATGGKGKHIYGIMLNPISGKMEGAHRISYETYVSRIPSGLEIDHLCRNTLCINPEHLEPVTRSVNLRRGINHGRDATHCKRGHPLSGDNIEFKKNGTRRCLACRKIQWQEWAKKNQKYIKEKSLARGTRKA